MSDEFPKSKEALPEPTAMLFDPSTQKWHDIRDAILEIDKACFGEKSFPEEELRAYFEDPDAVAVLLKRKDQILGFSGAISDKDVEGALYIDTTDIVPEEQEKRHVVLIMKILEEEARKRGYKFLTRNAAIENGYADKILKNYSDRILESYENDSEWGPQRYFKIKL